MVSGILLTTSIYTHVLFDSSAAHSFVSSIFMQKHNMPYVPLELDRYISTLVEGEMISNQICRSCLVQIKGRELNANLIVINFYDFDIILDID